MPIAEVATPYGARAAGTVSKLSTYQDGLRILRMIMALYRREYPARFFAALSAVFALTSTVLAVPLVLEYLSTGQVPRFPTAILCVGLMLCAGGLFGCGLILDTVTHGRREIKRLIYLATSLPMADLDLYNRRQRRRRRLGRDRTRRLDGRDPQVDGDRVGGDRTRRNRCLNRWHDPGRGSLNGRTRLTGDVENRTESTAGYNTGPKRDDPGTAGRVSSSTRCSRSCTWGWWRGRSCRTNSIRG